MGFLWLGCPCSLSVLHLAQFLVLVLADCILPCFRLLLCGEIHYMVHGYLTLQGFAYLYLVLVIVVYGLSVNLSVRKAVATALLHVVQNVGVMRSFS